MNLSPLRKVTENTITLIFFIMIMVLFSMQTVYAEEDAKESKQDTYNRLKVFSEILSLIESNYVEPVGNDTMIDGAIKGMVKALDPHTSYLPPVSYKEMQKVVR